MAARCWRGDLVLLGGHGQQLSVVIEVADPGLFVLQPDDNSRCVRVAADGGFAGRIFHLSGPLRGHNEGHMPVIFVGLRHGWRLPAHGRLPGQMQRTTRIEPVHPFNTHFGQACDQILLGAGAHRRTRSERAGALANAVDHLDPTRQRSRRQPAYNRGRTARSGQALSVLDAAPGFAVAGHHSGGRAREHDEQADEQRRSPHAGGGAAGGWWTALHT